MNYYKRYIGDYQSDTAHLSLAEHGAYSIMLDYIYGAEKPLPKSMAAIFRLCRAFEQSEQDACTSVITQFFEQTDDGWINQKALRIMATDMPRIEAARINGRLGGRPASDGLFTVAGKPVPAQLNEGHFIYLMYDKSNSQFKIGETKNLKNRRYDIKRPTVNLVVYDYAVMDAYDCQVIEKQILKEYLRFKVSGDWFSFTENEANEIILKYFHNNPSGYPSGNQTETQDESSPQPQPQLTPKPSPKPQPEDQKTVQPAKKKRAATNGITGPTWIAYKDAYYLRYGAEPIRNATVNGQLSNVVKRLGAEDSPHVAAFYVQSNNSWYMQKGHSIAALLNDCEKLHTEWRTGRQVTSTTARQVDRTQSNANAFSGLLAEAEAKEAKDVS